MPWRLFHSRFADYRPGTLVEYPTGVWAGFPPEAMQASIPVAVGAGGRLLIPETVMEAYREAHLRLPPETDDVPPKRQRGRPRRQQHDPVS